MYLILPPLPVFGLTGTRWYAGQIPILKAYRFIAHTTGLVFLDAGRDSTEIVIQGTWQRGVSSQCAARTLRRA